MMFTSALLGLFLSAFVAATLLPAQSELALAGLLIGGMEPVWLFVAVATLGNVLGSCVNWLLGRFFNHFQDRSWFPIKRNRLQKAELWYRKYGRWTLLLSWAPVIGDPLTLVAGLLREPFGFFVLIVFIAKLARYIVVAATALQLA
ncbi:DedA family protein [Desulfovibrio sp. OttesenSCG-928-C06]|nr:DedA family protein [Desulfovibrio sp. OttesenSCG-928-C06]